MASSLELFCGKSLNNHTFWQHNVYGYCYEQLIFVLSSHVLLALVSVVCICLDHTNNTSALPTNHTLKRSTIQNIRLVIAISSALIPALSLLLNQFLGTTNPAPFNYLVDSISSIAWMLLSLYLWKFRCHSERATRTHRPVIFALTLTLLLVSQGIRLSTIIKQLLNDDNTLFVGDEVTVITATTLQILYFLSLLPSPRRITKKYMERGNVSSYRSINEDRGSDHQSLLTSPEELQHRSSLWIAEDNANLLSKFTLWWMQPLVRKGAKGELQNPCDLFHLPKKMATIHVDTYFSRIHLNGSSAFKREFPFESNHEDRISDNGSTQIQKSFTKNPNNNNCPEIIVHGQRKRLTLFRALFKAFGLRYLAWSAVQLICTALLVVNPLLLHSLLTFMDDPSEPIINGYLYAAGMVSVSALSYLFSNQCQYQFEKIKTEARAALITTVYRKALAVSATRLSTFTPGQVINFMSVDSKRASRGLMSVYNLWTVPFQVSIALFAVYKQIGVAVIGGLTVLVILMPLTKYLMGKIIMFHKSMLKQKDCRVKFMNEMLSGIRVIKFYSWERQFKKQIKDLRSEELRSLKAVKYLAAFNVYIWSTLSIFIPLCTLSTYVLMGNQLTAPTVFTSLALLSTIEKPLNAFPKAVNHVLEGWVSIGRLQQFMDLPESELSSFYISSDKLSEGEMLTIRQGTFIWDNFQKNRNKNDNSNVIQDDTDVGEEEESGDTNHTLDYKRKYQESVKLEGIDLNVMKGQLVGVIGRTGSGKSSLLAAILGDMEKEKGSIGVAGLDQGFGVSTQEPWLQYATVKENILFGREYEASRYKRVIEACALVEDFKIWPAGDNTEVGDNGIILSGGQRARVALARAVYQESEIYLLDDPLAALDAHVGQQIFSKCIMGLLENKTRILCTHHIRFLVDADIMIVMDGFKIVNQGPPSVVFNLPQYAKQPNYSEIESRAETGRSESGKEFLGGNLAEEEEKEQGAVKFGIYRSYWKAIGSYLAFFIIVMFLLTQASTHIIDWWLSYWTSHTKDQTNQTVPLQPVTPSSDPETHGYSISTSGTNSSSSLAFYLGIYLGLVVTNSVFAITEAVMFAYGCVHAAQIIHDRLLNSIIKAPIYFFDKTPVGRILNRFSSDTYVVDYTLSLSIFGFIGGLLTFLAKAALTCYGIPLMLLCLIPLCAFYYFIQNYYRKTSRELRRIYNVTNSAIYRHFSETLAGLTVIKGMRATNRFRQEIISRVDLNQRAFFMERALEIWLSIRLSLIGLAILTGVAVFAVIKHHYNAVDTSLVGLALLYSLSITQSMKSIIRGIGDTEQDMVSLERLRYYTADIPQEPRDSFIKPPSHWPKNGVIKFKNVHFSYREDLPKSMDGVSFESLPGEKIGIVGRSGSGKSTLFLALFRMVQIQQGCVTIDGIDLGHLSPEDVRSRLAIIPQDPFLLSGSVRMNLDPVGQFSDSELWCVLEKCHIKDVVTRMGGIEASAGEGGKQFSTGQKQLMCLARAMLTKKKVLCIDEATSGVDLETDAIMQGVIKEEFQDNTILTIAHRLDVVEDCDRILVMDTGKVVKFE